MAFRSPGAIGSGILLTMLRCGLCGSEMAYIHGHAACVRMGCPMAGVNQAECCSGETACGIEVARRGPTSDEADGEKGAST
jgi:hypothetical protein